MRRPASDSSDTATSRRAIPQVDRLLTSEAFQPLLAAHPRAVVVREVRSVLDELRRQVAPLEPGALSAEALRDRVAAGLAREARPYHRRVINGTGVVLHTGIGRAVLAAEAVEALAALAPHPQRLEIDLDTGQRGGRDEGCARLLQEITGCEDATVVNNNAAATLLLLAAVARGKEVVLSRGELVEIGGSFRIPEVMSESGAVLVEVGTTNRTHLRDYRAALGASTGLLLKVHTSNYRIEGFTAEVEIEDLVALGRERGVPVAHDLGSGCVVDLAGYGLPGEPLLRRSVAAGVDLLCVSGDKLLGGPQAGILLGKKELVDVCRRHPLYRALRPGRLVYTALEATLRLYLAGAAEAVERVPVLRQLTAPAESLLPRARRLEKLIAEVPGVSAEAVPCASQAGSGALPARDIPSQGVRVTSATHSAQELADALRTGDPAILVRLHDGAVLFDVRTLADDEVPRIAARLRELAEPGADLP